MHHSNLENNPMAHLKAEQRYTISVLLQQGKSKRELARVIGRHPSVVTREISRNSSPESPHYDFAFAHQQAQERQRKKLRSVRFTEEIKAYVSKKIREDYSPEQVVGNARRLGIPCVGITSIYKYIWANKDLRGEPDKLFHHLRHGNSKGLRSSSKRVGLGVIPDRKMIADRPAIVAERSRFGDFEADTMWLAGKAVVVTVNDRATGLGYIRVLADRKSDRVNKAIAEMLAPYKGRVHSLTVDNGKEFYKHKELAGLLGVAVFFADPYASWQRGANENLNGLYRQFLPRKTQISTIDQKYIKMIESKLNNRPRKRLGFLSPIEFFNTNFETTHVAF